MSALPRDKRYDPRIGDEGSTSSGHEDQLQTPPAVPLTPVKQEGHSPESNHDKKSLDKGASPRWRRAVLDFELPTSLRWIQDNWTWAKWKPAIRCAVSAWASLVLLVVNPSLRAMGQASFLVLIASMLSPPSDPFAANTEREIIILVFVLMAWGWQCLGIKLASLARTHTDHNASINDIFSGKFVEAGPSVILAVFLFLGSVFFLYVKAKQGPGPFLFATVLGCICLDIGLTSSALFPYAYYKPGEQVVKPLAFHAAIAIASSVLIFPTSVAAQYSARLRGVVGPISAGFRQHLALLEISTSSSDFSPKAVRASASKAEGALAPLAASARLLKRDVSFGRFSGRDLDGLREKIQRLVVRAHGMNVYFSLIDPTRERFPVTPAPSRPGTPVIASPTPNPSRPPSPPRADGDDTVPSPTVALSDAHSLQPEQNRGRQTRRRHPHFSIESPAPSIKSHTHAVPLWQHRHNHRHSHVPSLASIHHTHFHEHVVGVFESQRYLDLESQHFSHPMSAHYTERSTALLRESCEPLLRACSGGLGAFDDWLGSSRKKRWLFFRGGEARARAQRDRLDALYKANDELTRALGLFRQSQRHLVLGPYREAFSDKHEGLLTGGEIPPHRFLFHAYTYQYHLMEFAAVLTSTLEYVTSLEKERLTTRLWLPALPLYDIFRWSIWDRSPDLEQEDDENPDIVQGKEGLCVDLGLAQRRDPDALPPRNAFEALMNIFYHMLQGLTGGDVLFAIKAGVLTALLSIPSFIQSSASFAYGERFSWAIFMGQLTLARFRGDTTFGLVARIISTFFGGLTGAAIWYISTGSGTGNPYGLAATCAVAFPFFFYARLYWPGPPMTNIIFFATTALVIGFSWQNTHFHFGKFLYYGIDLAWRRFVLVSAGVTAAFIFSFLPPSTTLRRYQRHTFATAVTEIGSVYCSIVSYASAPDTEDPQHVIQSLIAIRLKLRRSIVLRTNIIYEFSLRGRWPAERYQKILDIQLEIAYLLSHLMSVIQHLEPAWTRAFLRRTRFLEPDFQGDVLAVISLISTALRTGVPLPQVTPCPLLDRFVLYHHGLNVIRHEEDDDYGLPRTMSIDILENEQYLCFCVGVSTAFGIVTRLDRLMLATKELVGEQYHIHGVGYISKMGGVELGSRINSLRPPHDV
ncbi:hypothetical protein BC834DRAFT_432593 [Gloeopeniophorella convolvens]|nr:hypothetical protein BC834DRAFT_432593 [Gloeopeniophorella convolvens]